MEFFLQIGYRNGNGEMVASPRGRMDNDKRLRREIANSNERRRMQSINAGFQSLKALLPRRDGEKMSKVRTQNFHHFFATAPRVTEV